MVPSQCWPPGRLIHSGRWRPPPEGKPASRGPDRNFAERAGPGRGEPIARKPSLPMRTATWLPQQRAADQTCYWGLPDPARSATDPPPAGVHHRPERAAPPLTCGTCGARWDGTRWSYAGRTVDDYCGPALGLWQIRPDQLGQLAKLSEQLLAVLAPAQAIAPGPLAPRWGRAWTTVRAALRGAR